MKTSTKLWIGIMLLIILSPLGLLLPEHFKAGAAWGEWGMDEIRSLVGYIPSGLAKLSELWKAPLPGYTFQGWEEKGLAHTSFTYIISAIVGIALTAAVVWFMGRKLTKKED
ncbi:MAG: PDGLE domain-containing protein [Candidatus Omnitrophica bacterium]|nr:PDGLE domain-containing protein [Candidatus Omnitrophota bacterium]